MQLGCVQLIAANEISSYSLSDQSGGHAECVRPVLAAGKEADPDRTRGAASRPLHRAIACGARTRSFQRRSGCARLLLKGHHEFQQ